MNIEKETLKGIDDSEEQVKLTKHAEEYKNKTDSKNSKMQAMIANTNYLKWLEKFTLNYPNFTDNDWLYFEDKISKEDNEKINDLHLLYEAIELYASKNYIYPNKYFFGSYYNIKLDNVGYEIGRLSGQGTLFFCNRKELNKDLEYIDFNDIISNKKKDNTIIIENRLTYLSNLVISLYNSGVPLEAIINTLDTTTNEIKFRNESDNIKILRKKK